MTFDTHYRGRKLRRERALRKCANMRAAKERKRMEQPVVPWQCVRVIQVIDPDRWTLIHTWILWAHPDENVMQLEIDGKFQRIGSERTMRGILAKAIWNVRQSC